jgi:hypothetical protein
LHFFLESCFAVGLRPDQLVEPINGNINPQRRPDIQGELEVLRTLGKAVANF